MTEEYLKAQKKGLSQYRKDLSAGRYPYPVSLDDLLPQAKRRGTESVGQMEIPLADVAGTVQHARQDAFSRAFYPLLEEGTEFSAKWIALYQSQLKEGIRDPVRVVEYLKRFYVLEGNKRVSVSRFVGAVSVMADITRILPLREDEENAWYEEFLRFFAATRTYEIDCRKEGSYEKITRAFGMELTAPCDRESLTVLLSAYRRFEACLRTRLIGEEAVCAGDAFGVYLDIYGSGDLLSLNEGALSARLEKLRAEIRLLLSDDIAYVEMPAGEAADTPHSLFSIFRNKPLYSGEHPLKAAMIHERTLETSAWVYGHELGRNHILAHFAGTVECLSFDACDTEEKTLRAIDDAVSSGAEVIFTTSPFHMPATLKSAIHYPQVRFLNCSVNLPHKAVRTYETRLYEAKFLMGALAASYTDNHRITYIADLPVYGAVANINAFALGVSMVDPFASIDLFWSARTDFDQKQIVAESASDVFSGPDLNRPEYYARDFGVYRRLPEGAPENLAMPLRNWGRYYEILLGTILRGSFDSDVRMYDSLAVNYWWGMESGVVDVLPASHLPYGTNKLLGALRCALVEGAERPFDQLSYREIIEMHTLRENVHGALPSPQELRPEAQRITDIVGLPPEDAG